MTATATVPAGLGEPRSPARRLRSAAAALVPTWSVPAAYRAVRATLVIPGLFALTYKVVGDAQMATFAAFGGFATVVFAAFNGSRLVKLRAHAGLGLAGSALVVIGTAVHTPTALAAGIAVPVAFLVLFAGITGSNAASGATAALLAYVLPAASPGTWSMVLSRLEGWWLASAAGTIAVLLLSPRPAADRLRQSAAATAAALADELSSLVGVPAPAAPAPTARAQIAVAEARAAADPLGEVTARAATLSAVFTAPPVRPVGLGASDEALADLVEMLEWCVSLVRDLALAGLDPARAEESDRELLAGSAQLLTETASTLRAEPLQASVEELERLAGESERTLVALCRRREGYEQAIRWAFHARLIASAARSAAADALIVTRRLSPAVVAGERLRWQGGPGPSALAGLGAGTVAAGGTGAAAEAIAAADATGAAEAIAAADATGAAGAVAAADATGAAGAVSAPPAGPPARLAATRRIVSGHANLRSVWFLNATRGAAALAAAIAVADVTKVQHGFWVVLGALSTLRTSASATGSTAWRAVLGTALGVALGGLLVAGIGASPAALWAALPITIAIGAYAPGTAAFALGQAAFTVMISVLFNIIVPVGWSLGVVRVEDVGIGVAVSLVAGAMFWPRGASRVVSDDLAEAFHRGGLYLVQAAGWALGLRADPPDAAAATVLAGLRLEDALRAYLGEQGTKRVAKETLWRLVAGASRLRLTARSLATVAAPDRQPDELVISLLGEAVRLAGVSDALAAEVGDSPETVAQELARLPAPPPPPLGELPAFAAWVRQHLDHVGDDLGALRLAAAELAANRHHPWWR